MSNVARVAGQAANTLSKPLNVEEVFSTYLYTGTSSALTITNDIDLSGEGGLTWIKARNFSSSSHALFDTERGGGSYLSSNEMLGNETPASAPLTFNSDGFTINTQADSWNGTFYSNTYASWTFRKAPKFFDVVTYTGDGVAGRTVSHNLGSVPGCIIVKATNNARSWAVYHRGTDSTAPEDYGLYLDLTLARQNDAALWNDTAPSSTEFTVGTSGDTNVNGRTYVAYLFAHNDGDGEFGPDGDADIIKCGSVSYNAGATVDLGFEPQWVLIKPSNNTGNWILNDNMRGMPNGSRGPWLITSNNLAEVANATVVYPTPTGFTMPAFIYDPTDLIYIAIRRGPMAVPESATDVFAIDTKNSSGDNTDPTWDLGIVTDMAIQKFNKTTATTPLITSRLTGTQYLKTSETDAETSNSGMNYDHMTGVGTGNGSTTDVNDIVWGWKRAPNYFDVVAYTGNGVQGHNVSHNLGVAPDMMWVKQRSTSFINGDWKVYVGGITHLSVYGSDPDNYGDNPVSLVLNGTDAAQFSSSGVWDHTHPTDTYFRLGDTYHTNRSGDPYIAYLFASLDGVSKVGSYTGNGSTQTIDCGFSAGARFVLIKRTNDSSNWTLWDSERGIVSGNDPYLMLNVTNAEVTSTDIIDPDNSGFIVNAGGNVLTNNNGDTYIFYAIA